MGKLQLIPNLAFGAYYLRVGVVNPTGAGFQPT